jgi:hypothetical protein
LSLDGAKLLTITDTALVELDPVTLFPQPARLPPPPVGGLLSSTHLKAIVAANDGQAVVAGSGSTFDPRWLYAIASRTFTAPGSDLYSFPIAGGPGDGSRVVLLQGGLSPTPPIRQYSASSGTFSTTTVALSPSPGVAINDENVNPPVFDRSGTHIVMNTNSGTTVFDANFGQLGRLPATIVSNVSQHISAYALSPDGKRAYVLDVGSVCQVRAFNLDVASPGAGQPFLEIATGFPIDLSANCPAPGFDSSARMLLDPSGKNLFVAGTFSIWVVALP